MGVRHRLILGSVALALVLGGCSRKSQDDAPSPPSSARPPDRLGPDEEPEGVELLHGLRLPRRSRIVDRLADVTVVRTALTVEQLATYVRARIDVDGGSVHAGAASTRLERVVAIGGTDLLDLKIQTTQDPDFRSELHVRVLPKPMFAPEATQEERWRAAGVTPDGELIDRLKRE